MKKSIDLDKLKIGVCYYPEHWSESMWEDDLRRMRELGIEIVRVAEFAWTIFEPSQGVYCYDFFDRFLDAASKYDIKVIFCTPTATPPVWLTEKYPEVLNAKKDGTLFRHGMRRHYNYNSSKYRELCANIVEKQAAHYCSNPAVIGWQIDNELNCETDEFYSESDHFAFRNYLKQKFGTLETLNEALGTVFWNQTYTSWNEIHLSRTLVHDDSNNPHMSLEEKRFFSASAISFCKMQADIIRKYAPQNQFITTNGLFGHLDSHEMTDVALDFICYDSYPNFAFDVYADQNRPHDLKDRRWSGKLASVRSICPNFGIMEQQTGAGGWNARMKQSEPRPGQMRLWTYQSIANGADYIGYFRWRTSRIGTEIYWQGLNDWSNQPNRRLAELKTISGEFQKIKEIAGSHYQAKVALLSDYDNEWDGEQDQWHGPLDYASRENWIAAAQLTHTPMDCLYLRDCTQLEELQKYDLLIYPHATILTTKNADLLTEYVAQGGKLIFGARTGYKDAYGRCNGLPIPGFVAKLCGVCVTDSTCVGSSGEKVYANWDGEKFEMPEFNEILSAESKAQTLAVYNGGYYNNEAALVCNEYGKGTAYYLGAGFCFEIARNFLVKLGITEPYADIFTLPEKVEIAVRSGKNKKFIFLLNYADCKVTFIVSKPLHEMLTGRILSGEVELDKYGVAVFETHE